MKRLVPVQSVYFYHHTCYDEEVTIPSLEADWSAISLKDEMAPSGLAVAPKFLLEATPNGLRFCWDAPDERSATENLPAGLPTQIHPAQIRTILVSEAPPIASDPATQCLALKLTILYRPPQSLKRISPPNSSHVQRTKKPCIRHLGTSEAAPIVISDNEDAIPAKPRTKSITHELVCNIDLARLADSPGALASGVELTEYETLDEFMAGAPKLDISYPRSTTPAMGPESPAPAPRSTTPEMDNPDPPAGTDRVAFTPADDHQPTPDPVNHSSPAPMADSLTAPQLISSSKKLRAYHQEIASLSANNAEVIYSDIEDNDWMPSRDTADDGSNGDDESGGADSDVPESDDGEGSTSSDSDRVQRVDPKRRKQKRKAPSAGPSKAPSTRNYSLHEMSLLNAGLEDSVAEWKEKAHKLEAEKRQLKAENRQLKAENRQERQKNRRMKSQCAKADNTILEYQTSYKMAFEEIEQNLASTCSTIPQQLEDLKKRLATSETKLQTTLQISKIQALTLIDVKKQLKKSKENETSLSTQLDQVNKNLEESVNAHQVEIMDLKEQIRVLEGEPE